MRQVSIRKALDRSLSQRDRSDVKRREGRAVFRFGNGRTYKSEELVILPVYFGDHRAIMAIDVVDVKIPLLISLAAMKKANTVIRTATDTATICGQPVKLTRVGGHYTISLRKGEAEKVEEETAEGQDNNENKDEEEGGNENLMVKVFKDPKSWKEELKKLHSQMCHVPVRRIKTNLERGNVWKPEMESIN